MHTTSEAATISAIRLSDVLKRTGLSRATVYRLIRINKFPKQAKLGERASAWSEAEIDDWIRSKFEGGAK